MSSDSHSFMNYRALLVGALILAVFTLAMISLALFLGVERATAPQLLTLSSLWIAPALSSSLQVRDGRLLHGMLMGILGALLVILLIYLLQPLLSKSDFLQQLAGDSAFVLIILGGLWGSIGGIFAEIVYLRRIKKTDKQDQ